MKSNNVFQAPTCGSEAEADGGWSFGVKPANLSN